VSADKGKKITKSVAVCGCKTLVEGVNIREQILNHITGKKEIPQMVCKIIQEAIHCCYSPVGGQENRPSYAQAPTHQRTYTKTQILSTWSPIWVPPIEPPPERLPSHRFSEL
jgi:hypothetical protein